MLKPCCFALGAPQFEKEVVRCIKLLEEADAVVAKKKDVSQQVGHFKYT